jgi:thioredoxin 1
MISLEEILGMFDMPITTNDSSIDRVLATGLPVLMVFLEGSAPPSIAPVMDNLAARYAGRILLVKIQVKDNPVSTNKYQIKNTPALVAINRGQVVTKTEQVTASSLEAHLAYLLGEGPEPVETSQKSATQRPEDRDGSPRANGSSTKTGSPQPVTSASFESEVMRSSLPVLVDFWAPWCGPCRMIEPIVEKLAVELSGRLKVAKVNVDENPEISRQYGVQGIPMMMIVKNGRVVDQWMGAQPEAVIRGRVSPHL